MNFVLAVILSGTAKGKKRSENGLINKNYVH